LKEHLLQEINFPKDIKKLSFDELNILAEEIRTLIIQTVSETGGHLASNLGAVELTLALHKVFNFPEDKLIFDVSHQVYTHKIITNRKGRFSTLRQFNGISGYANPYESNYDTFIAGHASTSLALALGFAEARKVKKQNHEIIALIGDGALTAGEAYEGLNNLGRLKEKVIIVLNDNEMSISRNVGAMSQYLSRIRSSSFYQNIKSRIPRTTAGRRIKLAIKDLLLPVVFFEEIGFTYLGPVNGHNIKELTSMFEKTKNIKYPTVVHVVTKKGKGYKFAEENPTKFHSAHPFFIDTGKNKDSSSEKSFSDVFGDAITNLGEKNDKLFTITAAMPDGTKTSKFRDKFPERFLDVGIAEQCAVTAGAAMAKAGLKPIVAIYSTFMQRAYDQLVHDVGILDLPVVFALDRAGVVSQDGPTHQGVFDLSFMRTIPNFVVMAPKDAPELRAMIEFALSCKHPTSIRYPKDYAIDGDFSVLPMHLGKAELVESGEDLLIISIGVMYYPAFQALKELKKRGISVGLINARFVKPLDKKLIVEESTKSKKVLTIEDNTLVGGFGSAVKEILSDKNGIQVRSIGINDIFPEQGNRKDLLKMYGLSSENIVRVGEDFVKEKD
jgi:1-deoxy-D-xylulose-5-phosphate synthase